MAASAYDRMAHLWRRAAFGARPDEINNYLKLGFEATVDQLVNYENVTESPDVPAQPTTTGGGFDVQILDVDNITAWWLTRMIYTKRPLQQRMTIFWHDHFATSISKVNVPNGIKYLYWQNLIFQQYATGDFRALCKAINRDPAMLWWLDNYLNIKGSPNENYARELMEIFMLGLDAYFAGGYTEPDVQQAARAFTGWTIRRGADVPVGTNPNGPLTDPAQAVIIPPNVNDNSVATRNHDYGDKTVFGVVQNFNGDDIVDLILNKEPQRSYAARMLGKKLFEHFAYENPEASVVDHMTAVVLRHNFNLKFVLRDLFLNTKEFYSDKAIHALVKWPVHYVVSGIRLLQATVLTRGLNGGGRVQAQQTTLDAMGMALLNPPDVFGWPGKEEWITTSQLLARDNWANGLATNRSTTAGNTGIPIDAVLSTGGLGASATAEQVVDYFTLLLIQRRLSANVRQALVDYLKMNDNGSIGTFTLDAATKDKKIRGLIHLLLSRPECQNF
ncbi:MAG TPA: DUF1800 domain-containing protein [Blastocatellia bacterium]|nr:DUF1800 domain-containing protein [Blastocatellia bacterium]